MNNNNSAFIESMIQQIENSNFQSIDLQLLQSKPEIFDQLSSILKFSTIPPISAKSIYSIIIFLINDCYKYISHDSIMNLAYFMIEKKYPNDWQSNTNIKFDFIFTSKLVLKILLENFENGFNLIKIIVFNIMNNKIIQEIFKYCKFLCEFLSEFESLAYSTNIKIFKETRDNIIKSLDATTIFPYLINYLNVIKYAKTTSNIELLLSIINQYITIHAENPLNEAEMNFPTYYFFIGEESLVTLSEKETYIVIIKIIKYFIGAENENHQIVSLAIQLLNNVINIHQLKKRRTYHANYEYLIKKLKFTNISQIFALDYSVLHNSLCRNNTNLNEMSKFNEYLENYLIILNSYFSLVISEKNIYYILNLMQGLEKLLCLKSLDKTKIPMIFLSFFDWLLNYNSYHIISDQIISQIVSIVTSLLKFINHQEFLTWIKSKFNQKEILHNLEIKWIIYFISGFLRLECKNHRENAFHGEDSQSCEEERIVSFLDNSALISSLVFDYITHSNNKFLSSSIIFFLKRFCQAFIYGSLGSKAQFLLCKFSSQLNLENEYLILNKICELIYCYTDNDSLFKSIKLYNKLFSHAKKEIGIDIICIGNLKVDDSLINFFFNLINMKSNNFLSSKSMLRQRRLFYQLTFRLLLLKNLNLTDQFLNKILENNDHDSFLNDLIGCIEGVKYQSDFTMMGKWLFNYFSINFNELSNNHLKFFLKFLYYFFKNQNIDYKISIDILQIISFLNECSKQLSSSIFTISMHYYIFQILLKIDIIYELDKDIVNNFYQNAILYPIEKINHHKKLSRIFDFFDMIVSKHQKVLNQNYLEEILSKINESFHLNNLSQSSIELFIKIIKLNCKSEKILKIYENFLVILINCIFNGKLEHAKENGQIVYLLIIQINELKLMFRKLFENKLSELKNKELKNKVQTLFESPLI